MPAYNLELSYWSYTLNNYQEDDVETPEDVDSAEVENLEQCWKDEEGLIEEYIAMRSEIIDAEDTVSGELLEALAETKARLGCRIDQAPL